MKARFHPIILVLAVLTVSNNSICQVQKFNIPERKGPRNIILMIGDGMGITHMQLAARNAGNPLNIKRCTNTAFVTTVSSDDEVTDSAAAGTAMATGSKTKNGAIGVDSTGKPLKSILKFAEEYGLATGLVATSEITHATPASFIASVENRNQVHSIASQFLQTDIEVFIGGGFAQFANRPDSINYIDSLKQKGYSVVTSPDQLLKSTGSKIAGLLYPSNAPTILEGRGSMLSDATSKAIDILSKDEDGFFLMVEGSQIDWGAHANNVEYMVTELIDFDKAVGVALDYALTDPETLVIVTSDHETGGLTLIESEKDKNKVVPHFSTTQHTGELVGLFAYGKGAQTFKGFIDNTDIFKSMISLYGFTNKKKNNK